MRGQISGFIFIGGGGVRNQTSWFTFREGRRGYDGRVYLEVIHQGLLMGGGVVDGEGVTVVFTCQ